MTALGPAPKQVRDDDADKTPIADVESALRIAGFGSADLFALDDEDSDDPADAALDRDPGRVRRPGRSVRSSPRLVRPLPETDRSEDDSHPHLFPPFPGCDTDRGLYTHFGIADCNVRHVSDRQLRALEGRGGTDPSRREAGALPSRFRAYGTWSARTSGRTD
jgi:hypothetical protein